MTNAAGERRGGFAMIVVIVLLGLVAAAMASVTTLVVYDARRTRQVRSEAQLREMLLAGAAAAQARAATWSQEAGEQSWSVALPPELAREGAALTVRLVPQGQDELRATVTAQLDERSMRQRLALKREGQAWKVAAAALGEGD
jgi:type II secretory pathway pseudopilin PulG